MHTHPGEEIIYVIEGTLEYEIGGKVTRVKRATSCSSRPEPPYGENVGTANAELATYVVGKPLLTPVK
jgi:quercetin dioxygenase-like cupin family protein